MPDQYTKPKTDAAKNPLERGVAAITRFIAPKGEEQKYRMITNDVYGVKFGNMNTVHGQDVTLYKLYQDYYDGTQWQGVARDANRTKLVRNLCSRIVKVKGGLLGTEPIITVPRDSERKIKYDVAEESGENKEPLASALDKVDVQQKLLRRIMRETDYAKVLKDGGHNSSKFGVRYNYLYWDKDKKRVCAEELFPGYVRVKYKNTLFNELLYAFVSMPMEIDQIERQFGITAAPDKDINVEAFKSTPEYGYLDAESNQALVTFYWGPCNDAGPGMWYMTIINGEVVKYEKWDDIIPIFPFRKNPQPARRQGISDLRHMVTLPGGPIGMQDNYNIVCSDELDIIGLYAWPRIVVRTDGQIDVGVIMSTKARILKLPKDANASVLEFSGKVYELNTHRNNLIDDISKETGVPKSAWGVPDTSIITGAGINAEWQPMISEARNEFIQNLAGILVQELRYAANLLRKYGGKEPDTGLDYKDLLPEVLEIKIEPGIKVPRDEQGWINMVTMMKEKRLISISTGIRLLNYVESSDDEMKTIAQELVSPLFNPELALKAKQMELDAGAVDAETEEEKAYDENMRMARGVPVGMAESKPEQHRIHLLVHKDFESSPAFTALTEAEQTLVKDHIQAHEDALAGGPPPEAPVMPTAPGAPDTGGPTLGNNPSLTAFPNPDVTAAPPAGPAQNQPGQQPLTETPPNQPMPIIPTQ